MMKVTRDQAREIINFDLVAMHCRMKIDPPVLTAKDITRMANGAYGEIALLMTGAKLYRYKDRSGSPAYAVMGYSSDGSDVSKLGALIGQ